MKLDPIFEAAIAGMRPKPVNDAVETLQALEQQVLARKPSPFTCRALTEEEREQVQAEADEERAEDADREHFYAHPEQYR